MGRFRSDRAMSLSWVWKQLQAHLTPLRRGKLWPLARLQWWRQMHVDGLTVGALT